MRPENVGRGMEGKAGREVSTATAPAPQGAVPAAPPAGEPVFDIEIARARASVG